MRPTAYIICTIPMAKHEGDEPEQPWIGIYSERHPTGDLFAVQAEIERFEADTFHEAHEAALEYLQSDIRFVPHEHFFWRMSDREKIRETIESLRGG